MSFITRTPAGKYRANWRDPAGRQRAKTFPTKRDANAFLAEIGAAINRGTYVDPGAGKTKFGPYAERWLAARNVDRTTADRDCGLMRNHVVPYWRQAPLAKIDYLAVQEWVGELASRRAPATVTECFRLMSNVMRAAMCDRLIGHNPCEGVRLPKRRKLDIGGKVLTRAELAQLLPVIPTDIAHSWRSRREPACAGVNASVCGGSASISRSASCTSSGSPLR